MLRSRDHGDGEALVATKSGTPDWQDIDAASGMPAYRVSEAFDMPGERLSRAITDDIGTLLPNESLKRPFAANQPTISTTESAPDQSFQAVRSRSSLFGRRRETIVVRHGRPCVSHVGSLFVASQSGVVTTGGRCRT